MSGINVVGVQFRKAGKIYDFHGSELLLQLGDRVVVETERGLSLAEVKRLSFEQENAREPGTLKPVVRIATKKDLDTSGRLDPEHAERFSKDKIQGLGLEMNVISVEVQFGGNKVIIYFSAPGRVDFRELVKELASGLKTRVELKQVGARDEAKLSGGLGICGREFCCSSFLREFVPVSIKMAKNQNLALNPSKVSGGCGRLLCCLTYEDATYSDLRQKLLPKGARVKTPEDGFGDVIKGDVLNQVSLVELDSGDQKSYPLDDLEVVEKGKGVEDDWADDLDLGALMDKGDQGSKEAQAKPKSQKSDNDGQRSSGDRPSKGRGRGPRKGDAKGDGRQNNRARQDRSRKESHRKDGDPKDVNRKDSHRKDGDQKDGNRKDGERSEGSRNRNRNRSRNRNRNRNRNTKGGEGKDGNKGSAPKGDDKS